VLQNLIVEYMRQMNDEDTHPIPAKYFSSFFDLLYPSPYKLNQGPGYLVKVKTTPGRKRGGKPPNGEKIS